MKKILFIMGAFVLIFGVCHAGNVTNQNPMILDTAGSVSTSVLYITDAIWHGCSTEGQEVVVKNKDGKTIGYAVCVEGTSVKIWDKVVCTNGLTIDTIDSGDLYIYLNNWKPSDILRLQQCKDQNIPLLK